jgi:uncharacterized protein (TIGR03435 family)
MGRQEISGVLIAAFVGAASAVTMLGQGQTLTFEVATIKPHSAPAGVTGGCRGIDSRVDSALGAFRPQANDPLASVPLGRCVITAGRLSHLMSMAFDVPIQRMVGLPDWDGPNRFDIQAKAEDPATTTEGQLLSMLQAFLIDRFRLAVRHDTKDGPTFALLVAKNGPKNLHPSNESDARMVPHGASLVFKGYSMAQLAGFFSMMPAVQRPVVDQTNIDGRFDFNLDVLGAATNNVDEVKTAMVRWESLFSDIQEQLGLHLERAAGPIEQLVIDHVERPTPD